MTKKTVVQTKNAAYVVDRDSNMWMRTSESHPKADDNSWIEGGFTIGDVGESCFAHYDHHSDGAAGRWTSRVVWVANEDGTAAE